MYKLIDYLYFIGYCLYGTYYYNHPRFKNKEDKEELVGNHVSKQAVIIPSYVIIVPVFVILMFVYFSTFEPTKLGFVAFTFLPCVLIYLFFRKRYMNYSYVKNVRKNYNDLSDSARKKNKGKAILIVSLLAVLQISSLIAIPHYISKNKQKNKDVSNKEYRLRK